MNNWPGASDYRDSLQHPDKVFRLPELRACKVEVNKMGVPRARSGAFANVYKLVNPQTQAATALKLFLYANPERQQRYQAVSDHLKKHRPKCIVDFQYLAEGIRIGGAWFPAQTMQWVKGKSLRLWAEERAAAKDASAFARMAEKWSALVRDLQDSKIAHGDLQHDNVMVVGEDPVLVDYDCMTTPALVGLNPFEHGKPAYQHPGREKQLLSLEIDHYAAWIILVALRAVAADLNLYQKYIIQAKSENLLFSEEDLRNPKHSSLWKDLLAFKDREVRDWAVMLREALDAPFEKIPPFETDSFAPLRKLLSSAPTDWDAVTRTAAGPRLANKSLPAELVKPVDEARRRAAAREALRTAVALNDPRVISAAYQPTLVDDWADCATLVQRARLAREQTTKLDELAAALRVPGDGRKFLALWAKHEPVLRGLPAAAMMARDAIAWRERIATADALLAAVKANGPERAIAEAWAKIDKLGGHPDAEPHRTRALAAGKRSEVLDKLRPRAHVAPTETDDRLWVQLWDDNLFLGCTEADSLRPRLNAAKQRLDAVAEIEKAIAEEAVLAASAKLPPGYSDRIARRTALARQRISAISALKQVLTSQPVSDTLLANAFTQATAVGVQPTNPAELARCQLSVRRRDKLAALRTIDSSPAVDDQDAGWLREWDEILFQGCAEADPLRPRRQLAEQRFGAWRTLDEALRRKDVRAARAAAGNAILAGYPPFLRRRVEIDTARQLADRLDQLQTAVAARDWETIATVVSAPPVSTIPLPADLVGPADEARRRSAARDNLRQAIASKKIHAIASAYEPALLDDWPACAALLPRAREARDLGKLLADLDAEQKRSSDGRSFPAQ
jgi:hypothetical protein